MNKEQWASSTTILDALSVTAFTTWLAETTGHSTLNNPLAVWEICFLLSAASWLFLISQWLKEGNTQKAGLPAL